MLAVAAFELAPGLDYGSVNEHRHAACLEEAQEGTGMADVNTVTVVGNLTRDPELRFTQTGRARAVLGVAVNRRWMNRQTSDWEEQVSYFNVVCWAELAENVSESLAKGNRVIVSGRLEQRSWDTPEGDQRSVVEIVADEIAPSLRWATAQVTRIPRSGNNGG